MTHACSNQDCTVAATGKCVLLHTQLETCPHYSSSDAKTSDPTDGGKAQPAAAAMEGGRSFFPGFELGTADASEIMRARYGTFIAVLGQYDVGKTCFLASLYLLVACGAIMSDLMFAGSLTLNGFETRARRLRQWKGGTLPQQLVDHTVLADPRTPAIMHLALREADVERRRFDLLITDLPGEWSSDLVKDVASASRFAFLKRADGIVIALDGPMLSGRERHAACHDAKLLLTRLSHTLQVDVTTPLVLMVTKSDELAMTEPPAVNDISDYAMSLGFSPRVIPVAAISRTPADVPSGTGVIDVVEHMLDRGRQAQAPAPLDLGAGGSRNFARIRG